MKNKRIYIVASRNNTVIGQIICVFGKFKFSNNHSEDQYSHISLSLDENLDNMMSFARRKVNNPLIAGLIREDIRKGVFAVNHDNSHIAVFELEVTEEQYETIRKTMEKCWENREKLKYNIPSLFTMMFLGRGVNIPDRYFCSQWVDETLKNAGIDLFEGRESYRVTPFDFYRTMKPSLCYEGATVKYPRF